MTTTKTIPTASKTPPPADAVARDPHWSAKLERLRNRRLPVATLRLWDDPAHKEALEGLVKEAARAELYAAGDRSNKILAAAAVAAVAARDKALAGADELSDTLSFRGLPGTGFGDLVKEHPPTEDQLEESPNQEWNHLTFPAALISATSVEELTVEDAQHLLDTWAQADRITLFDAALAPQKQDRADLGKG